MITSFLMLCLMGSGAPATYFYADGPALMRAQLSLTEVVGSGAHEVRPLKVSQVRLSGYLVFHDQAFGQALAISCRQEPLRTDEVKACDVFHIDRAGRALPLSVRAISAYLLPNDRFAFWTEGLELRSRALGGGPETVHARGVIDPQPSADRLRFGVAHVPALSRFEPGFDACPAVIELASQTSEPTRVPGPCQAAAPFISPDGAHLFVSTAGGMAAFWTQQRSAPAVQRTQLGVTELNSSFVPVAGRELVWVTDTLALYTADYDERALWTFDVISGQHARIALGGAAAWVEDSSTGRRAVVAVEGHRLLQLFGAKR